MRALRIDPPALKEALFSNSTNSRGYGRGRGVRSRGSWQFQATKWCTHCQRNAQNTEECWSKKRSHDDDDSDDDAGNKDKEDLKYRHCGESGHTQQNCAIREQGRQMERDSRNSDIPGPSKLGVGKVHVAVGTRPSPTNRHSNCKSVLTLTRHSEKALRSFTLNTDNKAAVDSSCSDHMCNNPPRPTLGSIYRANVSSEMAKLSM